MELVEVLTGFKFIGEKIKELDETGRKKYIFGFEESYGYLAGTFSRDKDAVVASMLICEMAAYYKSRGMSLYEGLQEIYGKYGFFIEANHSFTLEGREGTEKIGCAMDVLREDKTGFFRECEIAAVRDYQLGEKYSPDSGKKSPLDLPVSNVLYYELRDGSWFCIRPSGTEPKLKIYFGVSGPSADKAEQKLGKIRESVVAAIKKLLY